MIMTLNEALTRQNVLTKILLKEGDRELPKELKVKVMRMRMAYNKIKQNFDNEIQEFIKQLDEFNESIYKEFLIQKGNEDIKVNIDFFTLDEYSEIVEVNVDNNIIINENIIKAVDFLEVIYDLFVKENGIS